MNENFQRHSQIILFYTGVGLVGLFDNLRATSARVFNTRITICLKHHNIRSYIYSDEMKMIGVLVHNSAV